MGEGVGVPPQEGKQRHHTTGVASSKVFNSNSRKLSQAKCLGPWAVLHLVGPMPRLGFSLLSLQIISPGSRSTLSSVLDGDPFCSASSCAALRENSSQTTHPRVSSQGTSTVEAGTLAPQFYPHHHSQEGLS